MIFLCVGGFEAGGDTSQPTGMGGAGEGGVKLRESEKRIESGNLAGKGEVVRCGVDPPCGAAGSVTTATRDSATETAESNSESRTEQDIWRQIEALDSPCYVRFSCSLVCVSGRREGGEGELSPSPKKRVRLSSEREEVEGGERVVLEFEWIGGDSRDLLHQIVQYLKNTTFKT